MDIKGLAKIGKGTRRKKRQINLIELAEEISSLYDEYRSLKKAAEIIKLSPEMVRQFLKINELDENVKQLIKDNLITSVDICYRISKLDKKSQKLLAQKVVSKKLSSDDVRAIVKYILFNPRLSIPQVIDRVVQSKDRKIYVAYLGIDKNTLEKFSSKLRAKENIERKLESLFFALIPPRLIFSFELNGRVVILKFQKEGIEKLKGKARELKVPLARLADALIKEYLKRE
jgi:hypothetical protein